MGKIKQYAKTEYYYETASCRNGISASLKGNGEAHRRLFLNNHQSWYGLFAGEPIHKPSLRNYDNNKTHLRLRRPNNDRRKIGPSLFRRSSAVPTITRSITAIKTAIFTQPQRQTPAASTEEARLNVRSKSEWSIGRGCSKRKRPEIKHDREEQAGLGGICGSRGD